MKKANYTKKNIALNLNINVMNDGMNNPSFFLSL